MFLEEAMDLGEHGGLGFAGYGAPIDFYAASLGYYVGLTPSLDDAHVDGRVPQQGMFALPKFLDVLGKQEISHASHGVYSALAEMRCCPMGSLASSFKA